MSDNRATTESEIGAEGGSTPGSPAGGGEHQPRLLVAEDDVASRVAIRVFFERMGYTVLEAASGPAALQVITTSPIDLVILDLGLPGLDGSDVLAQIRRDNGVPVIVCTGRDTEEDRIGVLNLGADDYLVKPLSFPELEARIRAVLRRGQGVTTPARIDHGDLVIDRNARTVEMAGQPVTMTRKEFDLLAFLAASPGQAFSREDLLERVWGSTEDWQDRSTVTEHIRRVRLKIEPNPDRPRWITTVRGVGYRFSSSPPS